MITKSKTQSPNIKPKGKKLLTPRKMFLWGFNLIVGYTFLISFGSIFEGLGNWMPLIIVGSSIIAFFAGLSFGKLSSYFGRNGGPLLYTHAVFGKKAGAIVGMYQLLQLPVLASTVAIGFAWAFTGIHTGGGSDLSTQWYILIGALVLYFVFSIVPRYSFTTNQISLYILWILKWLIIVAMIIVALTELRHFGDNIARNGYVPRGLTYWTFIVSFLNFFFAFGGFEAVASVSDDLEDSEKNIPKVLASIIITICIFYLGFYFIIVGALGVFDANNPNNANGIPVGTTKLEEYNPVNSIFANLISRTSSTSLSFGAGAAGIILALALIITQISNKAASKLQSAWANTRILAAYSDCGYLPVRFSKKTFNDRYGNSFWLDFIISAVFSIIFIVFKLTNAQVLYSGAVGIVAYLSFVQYLAAILSLLWLKITERDRYGPRFSWKEKRFVHSKIVNKRIIIKNKELSVRPILFVCFVFTAIAIGTLLVSYIGAGIDNFILAIRGNAGGSGNTIWVTAGILVLVFVFAILIIIFSKIFGWEKHAIDISEEDIDDKIDQKFEHPNLDYKGA